MAKSVRAGKVFIDWSQNSSAKTTLSIKDVRFPRAGESLSLDTMTGDITLLGGLDLGHLQPFLPFAGVERATVTDSSSSGTYLPPARTQSAFGTTSYARR